MRPDVPSPAATRETRTNPEVDGEELYIGDAIHFFLDAKRAGGRSERTLQEYRKKLDLFQRWVAASTVDEEAVDAPYIYIGAGEVETYVVHLKERGLSDTSRKGHLAVLRSFFSTLNRRMKLPDPADDLDEIRFHQRAPKRNYLTKREAEMLLAPLVAAARDEKEASAEPEEDVKATNRRRANRALAARDHAAFSAMMYAGLRIEETADLTSEDLSFRRGEEEVRVAKGKGNKERLVPMGPKLRKSLRRYLKVREDLVPVKSFAGEAPDPHLFLNEKGRRVTENTLRRRLYKWVRQSPIKKQDIKPHDLRRTFGTWYLQDNPGQFVELAELMGHSDLSQVMKYALSEEQRVRAGVTRL